MLNQESSYEHISLQNKDEEGAEDDETFTELGSPERLSKNMYSPSQKASVAKRKKK